MEITFDTLSPNSRTKPAYVISSKTQRAPSSTPNSSLLQRKRRQGQKIEAGKPGEIKRSQSVEKPQLSNISWSWNILPKELPNMSSGCFLVYSWTFLFASNFQDTCSIHCFADGTCSVVDKMSSYMAYPQLGKQVYLSRWYQGCSQNYTSTAVKIWKSWSIESPRVELSKAEVYGPTYTARNAVFNSTILWVNTNIYIYRGVEMNRRRSLN